MAVRVVVDRGLCQGHGVCESEAPAVFAVSKKGELTILDENPPADQRPNIELAAKYCPTRALRILDEAAAETEETDEIGEREAG